MSMANPPEKVKQVMDPISVYLLGKMILYGE